MLIDTYGRVATDLRVSLTDRCNLRCTYCMPEEGLQWLAKPDLLTDDEIVRLIGIAVTDLGITEVRFTGGEPLLRPGLVGIVERVRGAGAPPPDVPDHQRHRPGSAPRPRCRPPGLDRVNVSLDTLRPDVFQTLTRRDRHDDVLAGLEAARDAGLTPVKVNAVLMPGLNDDEAPDLLAWAVEHDYELRFIEQMPLDAQHGWKRDGMVTAGDILAAPAHPLRRSPPRAPSERGSAPAERWLVDGGPAARRRHRLRHPPVLRGLRPHPADRRRPGPQLPVRPRGDRPAHGRCAPAPRTRRSPACGARRCGARRPGAGMDDPSFLQPDRPMSAIGG